MALRKVQSGVIADNAITTAKIASGAVTATDVPDGEITAAKLSSTAISDKLGYTPVSPTQLSNDIATVNNEIQAKTTIGKAIAMTIVFGG